MIKVLFSLVAVAVLALPAVAHDLVGGDGPIGPPGVGTVPLTDPAPGPLVEPASSGGANGPDVYATPEPSSLLLAAAGITGFIGWLLLHRRSKR